MYVVDLWLGSLVSHSRIMVGWWGIDFISSIWFGRLELMSHMFHVVMWVLMVVMFVGWG